MFERGVAYISNCTERGGGGRCGLLKDVCNKYMYAHSIISKEGKRTKKEAERESE